MTTLTDTPPTHILRPGYGVVFQFGEASVGARIGCVYLVRKPNVLGREESYYVVFSCVWAWDGINGYHFLGYVPEAKRSLTAEERLYFTRLAEETVYVIQTRTG